MSNTNFSDSHPAGHELFSDSESYMTPLSSDETDSIHGGEDPFNDLGDFFGYAATAAAAAATAGAAVASPAATPTAPAAALGASAAAIGASVVAFNQAYD